MHAIAAICAKMQAGKGRGGARMRLSKLQRGVQLFAGGKYDILYHMPDL